MPISYIESLKQHKLNLSFPFNEQLQQTLYGKQLTFDELPFTMEELQLHYENGYIHYHRGIAHAQNNQTVCNRCGNREKRRFATFQCARCEHKCVYCRHCIMLGRISQCTPLFSWTGPPPLENTKNILVWQGTLTPLQEKAADAIVQTIHENDNLLIWAVCGAGKTELLFKGIENALQAGKNVALATPRTDVVLELTPRFTRAFPNTSVVSLYGGSPQKSETGQLFLTTTHQLLRFFQMFDVMIIDEVDAFPFSFDKSLSYAVNKAKKPSSSQILLTATPSRSLKQQVKQQSLKAVTIKRRYHGFPLPVPTFQWCGHWQKQLQKQNLPKNVVSWCEQRIQQQKQMFLFVPSVQDVFDVTHILQTKNIACEGVYAEDPERHEKVKKFRANDIQLLVTTTILERGVTVPNIDVAILGAEDDVFTEAAIVQIAGRVGRSATYPTGDICLFHYGKTKAMIAARKHIEDMNKGE